MAHFAKIENGKVTRVVVVADKHEADGPAFLRSIGLEGIWVQTSYNNRIRTKFASQGDVYNDSLDRFEPAQPYPSWTWSEDLYNYAPPVPKPSDTETNYYRWDETSLSWQSYEIPTTPEADPVQ